MDKKNLRPQNTDDRNRCEKSCALNADILLGSWAVIWPGKLASYNGRQKHVLQSFPSQNRIKSAQICSKVAIFMH